MIWWRRLWRREELDRRLDAELRDHLERLVAAHLAAGTPEAEARRQAQIEFGGLEQIKEISRDARGLNVVDDLARDARYALRSLARNPGFACIAILTLALGIGANTAIFSLVDAVLIRPLPFPNSDRIAMVWEEAARLGYPKTDVSPANYVDWTHQSEVFEDLAAYFGNAFNFTGQSRPERLDGVQATPNLFSVLGVQPFLGRSFLPSEGIRGNSGFAILSHALWQRRFGSDAGVIGRSILLNGQPHVVVGVMPQGFQFPREDTQLWTPVAFQTDARARGSDVHFLRVVGRLKAGRSWAEAQTEFQTIAARLAAAYPATNGSYGAIVVPLHEEFVRDASTSLWLLQAAALLLLLVACGNVAGLLITRGVGRRQEIGFRSALGASRRQIVRQLLIEGLALSAMGGIAGVLVAAVTFQSLDALIPPALRGAVAPGLDWRILAFALTVSLLSGVLFGLAPLRGVSSLELTRRLGGRGVPQLRDRSRAVASTGLLVRTIINLEKVDPGFRSENVLTARLEVSSAGDSALEDRKRFYREVIERVRHGVHACGPVSRDLVLQSPRPGDSGGRESVQPRLCS